MYLILTCLNLTATLDFYYLGDVELAVVACRTVIFITVLKFCLLMCLHCLHICLQLLCDALMQQSFLLLCCLRLYHLFIIYHLKISLHF